MSNGIAPETATAAAPLSWEQLKDLGNQAFKDNLLETAVKHYTDAIAANPAEPVLYSNRSAAYLKKKSYEEAVADAQKAVALDSTFSKAYSRLHTALCNLGRFGEAASALKAGVSAVSSSPKTTSSDTKHLTDLQTSAEWLDRIVQSAEAHIKEGRLSEASRSLLGPLREFPDSARIAFAFAEATVADDPDGVISKLTPFAYSHSSDPHYLYLRAQALYYRGQDGFKSAQNILRQILGMDPDNEKARVLLKCIRNVEVHKENGNTAFKRKLSKEAIDEYTAAVDLDPTNRRMNATLRGNRAAAKMDLRDYKGALLDCDFAINNGADTAKMYARRSRIHENLENLDDAVRDMLAAAEKESSFQSELRQLKARAKRAKRKDYYKTLGLRVQESDDNEIKRAYKKACLQWHPDKWANASEEEQLHAEAKFKEVGEAFGVLSDKNKKRLYDSGQMDNDVVGDGAGATGAHNFTNAETYMNAMFGNYGGSPFGGSPFGGSPFGSPPQSGFRGGRGQRGGFFHFQM